MSTFRELFKHLCIKDLQQIVKVTKLCIDHGIDDKIKEIYKSSPVAQHRLCPGQARAAQSSYFSHSRGEKSN